MSRCSPATMGNYYSSLFSYIQRQLGVLKSASSKQVLPIVLIYSQRQFGSVAISSSSLEKPSKQTLQSVAFVHVLQLSMHETTTEIRDHYMRWITSSYNLKIAYSSI